MDLETIRQRRPVWIALSNIWVDTEINVEWIVTDLLAAPYDWKTIEYIAFHDVAPVVASNLWVVAGVWTGFDDAWLERKILAHAAKKRPGWWRNIWASFYRWEQGDTWAQIRECYFRRHHGAQDVHSSKQNREDKI